MTDLKHLRERDEKLSEEWLGASGFKWSQQERQPHKHWRLNLGWAADGGRFSCPNDLYVEVTPAWWTGGHGKRVQATEGAPWHCWIGGDGRGFVHVRHLQTCGELTGLIEALTGLSWDPANNLYGSMRTPEQAAIIRAEDEARDRRLSALIERGEGHE